jgi:hypothetical protein
MFEALPTSMAIMGVPPDEEGDGDEKEEEDVAGT